MANRKRNYKSKSRSKCPEPLNTMIDLAGAAAMAAYAKHRVKKDYAKGNSYTSAAVAGTMFAAGSMRSGSKGLLSLGGLYGVSSALKDIEKGNVSSPGYAGSAARQSSIYDTSFTAQDDATIKSYKTNDNRYAWRLNCEDGTDYGLSPYDYETREAYNIALQRAKEGITDPVGLEKEVPMEEKQVPDSADPLAIYTFCKVSRLDNGANPYYLAGQEDYRIGDRVIIPVESGEAEGIILSVEKYTNLTAPQLPEETAYIIRNTSPHQDTGKPGNIKPTETHNTIPQPQTKDPGKAKEVDFHSRVPFVDRFRLFKTEAYKVLNYTMDYSNEDFNPHAVFRAFTIGLIYQVIKRSSGGCSEKETMMDTILSQIDIGIPINGEYIFHQMEDVDNDEMDMLPSTALMFTTLEGGNPLGWIILNRAAGTYNLETRKDINVVQDAVDFAIGVDNYLRDNYPEAGYGNIALNYTKAAIDCVVDDFNNNVTIVD